MTITAELLTNANNHFPATYKLVLPNIVTTVSGDTVDIGRIERTTLKELVENKKMLEDRLDLVTQKIVVIEQYNIDNSIEKEPTEEGISE